MKKLITLLLVLTGMVSTASADDTYVVAGMPQLTGAYWSTTYAVMETSDDENYSITFNSVFLIGGWSYYYQVVKNSEEWFPGDNKEIKVNTSGYYDVTITFVVSTSEVTGSPSWIKDSGSALFIRGNMITTSNDGDGNNTPDTWQYDYPQYRLEDGSLTIETSGRNDDIIFKFKWTDNETWGGVNGGYSVENGIASNVAWALNGNYDNITIPQSSLKCDKYTITVNTTNNTFSVQGYYSKTIGTTGYSTFGSAADVDFSKAEPSLTSAQKGKVGSDGKITWTDASTLKGGEGAFLQGTPNQTYAIPVAASADADTEHNDFVAITTKQQITQTMNDMNAYILVNGADGLGFYKPAEGTGSWCAAGTAYLNTSVAPAASRGFFPLWDESTAIENIKNEAIYSNSPVYDMQGRRVVNATKGFYIVNGKKVIIK